MRAKLWTLVCAGFGVLTVVVIFHSPQSLHWAIFAAGLILVTVVSFGLHRHYKVSE